MSARAFLARCGLVWCALSPGALSSCAREAPAPEGQWVLHVDTDAPLPPAPGTTATDVALFDSLRIDVLADGRVVAGLSREFAVDEGLFRDGRASIGIVGAPERSDLAARVRLFRYARRIAGEPQPRTTLETTVRLPPVPAERVDHVGIMLRTDDVGRALGYPEPIAPEPWENAPSRVGTWKYAARTPCEGAPREGEVCVPGGPYWHGGVQAAQADDALTLPDERLTVVGPFFMDAAEVTRAQLEELLARNPSLPPHLPGSECSAVPEAAVDCVDWATARAVCAARGMLLPTEAQWEWVASGVGNDWDLPWGDVPACGDAAFGSFECLLAATPNPPRSFPRDQVAPVRDGPAIFDLAGNVSEWVIDDAVPARQPPWSTLGVLIDPVGVGAAAHAVRGANASTPLVKARVATRREEPSARANVGFRCVRRASPTE